MKTDGASRGLLDGAWWPRSRDLLSELQALTEVLDPLWGRITRIAVNPEHWPVIPREIPVSGHIVKTGAESAARLLAAASDQDGPSLTASALIAADAARPAVSASDQALGPYEAWDYEGGASAVSAAVTGQTGPPGPAGRLIIGM